MGNLLIYGIPVLFLLIVIYVLRPSARKRYQDDGEIPLEKNQNTQHKH